MSVDEFQKYLSYAVDQYAQEKIQAGNWSVAEGARLAAESYATDLPDGLASPGHYLFTLVNDTNESVGMLWYRIDLGRPQKAFLLDFEVYPASQRRGYATQSLRALDDLAKSQGIKRLELHVFGTNASARALYLKAGYFETNVQMAKELY